MQMKWIQDRLKKLSEEKFLREIGSLHLQVIALEKELERRKNIILNTCNRIEAGSKLPPPHPEIEQAIKEARLLIEKE